MQNPDLAAADTLKAAILEHPEAVLADADVLRALIGAQDKADRNVVDLRARFLAELEGQLGSLENTHRTVVAAAYENLSGTNQVQRAVLTLLEPDSFAGLLDALQRDLPPILGIDVVRLCLESGAQDVDLPHPVITPMKPGTIRVAATGSPTTPQRAVVLRAAGPHTARLFTGAAGRVKSEALLALDLGAGRLPALLALGAKDPAHFSPDQGGDLLNFLARALERVLRRWLT
ncbi:DUF484 family protein [Abyssibius alkaniclasticus]|uniref:DUF484 family protein n=1 Tax=Abyssibius alkaniclasticus TaxID=2881234 RepID=UPI00405A4307